MTTLHDRISHLCPVDQGIVATFIDFVLANREKGEQGGAGLPPVAAQVAAGASPAACVAARLESRAEHYKAHGRRLRELRELLGMTELEAAKKMDVCLATYQRYETGHQPKNSMKQIAYAEAVGVQLNWLIAGDGPMFEAGVRPKIVGNLVRLDAFRAAVRS